LRAGDRLVDVAQIGGHLLRLHHAGAFLRQRGFLRRRGREPRQLLDRVAQKIGLALRPRDLGAMGFDLGRARLPRFPQPCNLGGVRLEAAEGIEQAAMGRHIHQRALVVLTVDLDQRRTQRFQRLRAHRLIIDEGAGAAIGELHAPKDQLVLGRDVVCRHQRTHRVVLWQLEGGGHLPLGGTVAHQRDIAARPERQRERVEQDGLARTGLAGQHRQAIGKVDIEPIDQDDVANRKPGQHATGPCLLIPRRSTRKRRCNAIGA